MTAKDFTTKNHTSCNGCYFQELRKVTCMDDSKQPLIKDLFRTFGTCFSATAHIFVLKSSKGKNNTHYKRTKPFPVRETNELNSFPLQRIMHNENSKHYNENKNIE
jgi:hypothetical protein